MDKMGIPKNFKKHAGIRKWDLPIQSFEEGNNNFTTSLEDNMGNKSKILPCERSSTAEKKQFEISVIIPMYNQETEVSTLLSTIRAFINARFSHYELIVVNDGSTDNTLPCLEKELTLSSDLSLISYRFNMGKGYAVRQGVLQSTGALVLFIDSDLEISPGSMNAFIEAVQDCDLVIASKTHPLSIFIAPLSRRILSNCFNFLVRTIIGMKYRDTQTGLKIGKGDVLRIIFGTMLVRRYAFDVELLALSDLCRLRIKEMPTLVKSPENFKIKEIFRMALDIARITYRLKINRWYYKQLFPSVAMVKSKIDCENQTI
jgi:glycosyltransferase involved in cell wall biosynthesis